ncbi:protein tyrosine phosphatase [Ruminococcus sp. CLA-AA-H200]|uniref:protein-tyrosine-phosphatase n=1 Tax=Ruminococcus turbiniformis TaxID=2881258 RepID=A0ABS8FYT8_9FIRM|nr:CpsB/CapC family capsule biosynthesis tyrosine phosphatase [Ruminococcus turbiniformis]MCC2255210.1 protein tyrosine phosphatase [Ruminococcus turbiniformis]
MERYVDTHCHTLPEVDDGAQSMEEARQMLQIAYDEGIRRIIVTPHHHPRRGHKPPRILRSQLRLLREEAAKVGEDLRVYLGTEVYFGQDVPERLRDKKILTMNRTQFVLVEFSHADPFEYICQGIQQIQMKGFEVILAHIERYHCMCDDIENAAHMKDMGVRIQINADSITGENGRKVKRFVRQLMDRDLVFCVGTDAHSPKSRPPRMRKAAEYVKKKYGEEYMKKIFFSNARIMLKRRRKDESGQSST